MEANGKHPGPGHEPVGALPPIVAPRRLPGPQTGGAPGDQNGAAQLRHILDALRRRWLLVAFLGLVAGGSAGAAVWYLMPTPYTAAAELRLNPNTRFFYSEKAAGEPTVRFDDYRNNLVYHAKTQWVLAAALQRERRSRTGEELAADITNKNRVSPQQQTTAIAEAGKDESSTELEKGNEAAAGSRQTPSKPSRPTVAECETLRDVKFQVPWLERQLSVAKSGTQNIRISMSGEHRSDVCDIVNAVVDALLQEVVDKELIERQERLDAYQRLVSREELDLDAREKALEQLDTQAQTLGAEAGAQQLMDNRAYRLQVADHWAQIRLQIVQCKVKQKVLESILKRSGDTSTQNDAGSTAIGDEVFDALFAGDPAFETLKSALRQAEGDAQMAEIRFDPNKPAGAQQIADAKDTVNMARQKVQEFRTQNMAVAQERLQRSGGSLPTGTTMADLQAELEVLNTAEQEIQAQLSAIELKEVHLTADLIRRRKLVEEIAAIKARVKEKKDASYALKTELANAKPPVTAVYAEVPQLPDTAKQMKMAGVAGFGLFGAVGALIVWLEMLTRKVNRVTDVEQELHLQLIGSVPAMPRFAMKASDSGERSSKAAYWHSVLTESIDSARTLLLRYAKTSRLKRVMIASATGGEGKTSVSCHLATSLARAGRRVLLMDCDIRRPSIHWVFGLENGPGFCELLTREATPDEAVQEASPAGLHILPAGHVNSEVLRRLTQDDLEELLEQIGAGYDFVIIDTSPILPVTDALMFAQHVDGVLFSIRRHVSRMSKVQTAVQRLAMLGAPLLGAVAIGLDEGVYGARYQYKYNGYAYGRHPSQDEPNGALATSATEQR